jgi:ligand-binding SRPBCC domain-containing protein
VAEASFYVEIDAPPEEVWAVVADPRNLARWDRRIAAVEGVPADGLKSGAGYTTVMRFMGVKARIQSTVIEWEPPSWAVVVVSGFMDATVATRIDPLPGGRSRLQHEVDYHFRGSPMGELAARSIQLLGGAHFALRHGVLAQKRQIESGR